MRSVTMPPPSASPSIPDNSSPTSSTHPPIDRHSKRRECTQKLFRELGHATSETKRHRIRQQLVEVNMPVAASIARRYSFRGVNHEDIEQIAYVGLIKAVSRFDCRLDKDFLSFAVPTITGEVKRYFRDNCWAVRPPRRIQELQSLIPAERERLAQRLGRRPTLTDIAEALGVSDKVAAEAMAANGCFTPSSLDAPDNTGARVPIDQIIDLRLKGLAQCENQLFLAQLLQHLTARERAILHYRFVDGLTQHQIAEQIGVTQMQVSRLLSRLLRELAERAAA